MGQCQENNLQGIIDLHIHTTPDIRMRRLDDIELATEAKRVGARAIMIKSHLVPTMDRAWIAERIVSGVRVFGGITLNPPMGGLNVAAVDTAIAMGAKCVWLPTSYSAHERRLIGASDGVEVVRDGKVLSEAIKIFKKIAAANIILGTGHLAPQEIFSVVEAAKQQGVQKIVVNHPEWRTVNLSIEDQKALVPYGVYFERCYARSIGSGRYESNFERNVAAIQEVGYDTTIISTDGGQIENPLWSEALSSYIQYLTDAGIPLEEIDKMTKIYPAQLLGLDI